MIPPFIRQVVNGDAITITDPAMTRFMMTLDDAVDLVLHAFEHGKNGDIFVQKAPAATIEILVKALLDILNQQQHPVNVIGTVTERSNLKHSVVAKRCLLRRSRGNTLGCLPIIVTLITPSILKGEQDLSQIEDYNSHNTERLDVAGMKQLLRKLDFIREIEAGNLIVPEGV